MKMPRCLALVSILVAALPATAVNFVEQLQAGENYFLAPAPWLDPNAPARPSPPSIGPKAVISVPAINTGDIASVAAAYNTYYNIAMPAVGFTGSTASCTPGAISLAFQEWTISRINFLRAMAGVPGGMTLDSSVNGQEQAAALIMAANNTLNHSPPASYLCYTSLGSTGAGSSNLALGTGLTDSIPLYMSDPGSGNQVAGHRRWILHSSKNSFGLGQASGSSSNGSALYVFQSGGAVSVPNGIPWPPRGYVPLALFPSPFNEGPRWSFGYPGANFATATVTVTLNGQPRATTVVSRTDNGYGDNTIVWELPVGHTVVKGDTYNVTISGVSGASASSFSYVVLPFDPADVQAQSSLVRLGNISTRMQVLTGNNVLIGGFTVAGSVPKTVVVRARGPSLTAAGVPNALADPMLQLFSGQTQIASNDNWENATNIAALRASNFAPPHSLESAILATLSPGAYTAIVTGVGGTTGVGLIEIFEVDHPEVPLVNIATRGLVLTGNDVMIGGFTVQGNSPQTVVVRARGPSLTAQGVPGALANPLLQLFSGPTQIASNDNWQTAANAAAIQASGYAPANALESAILITLNPGAYTAIVTGAGGGTGVGIVEVFAQ